MQKQTARGDQTQVGGDQTQVRSDQAHSKLMPPNSGHAEEGIQVGGTLWTQIQSTVSPEVWRSIKAGLLRTHIEGQAHEALLDSEHTSNIADTLFDAIDVNSDGVIQTPAWK